MTAETTRSAELREWRRNLWTMWIAQMLSIIGFSFTTPFLPLYLRDLGLTSIEQVIWWSGVLNGGSALVMALAAPIWGVIADRYGRKPMVLRAMFGGAVIIGLMGLAPTVWVLLVLRLMQGMLTGTVTASITLVSSITPKDRLGFSLGLMQTAVFSGSSLGPFLGGVIADLVGYRLSFALTGALLGLAGLLVLFLVNERFERPAGGRAARPPLFRGMFAPLSNRLLAALVVVLFLISTAAAAALPLLPLFVEQLERGGGSVSALSGLTFAVAGVSNAIASIVFGRLADRIGRRRILLWCSLASGLIAIPQAFVQHPWQLIAMRGLYGIATGGLTPSANALIADVTPPEKRGSIYGLTSAASSFGFALGPFGASALAALVGIRTVFLATAGIMLVVSAWVARMVGGLPVPAGQAGRPAAGQSGSR